MYNVSSNFKAAILNNARRIKAHITVNGETHDIQKCTLDSNIYSTETDAFIGTFIAKSGTVKINKQDSLQLENGSFNLFFGIQLNDETVENVPMGNMNVYEKTSDTEYKFMDNKMLFNRTFDTTKLSYPTTPLLAAQEACLQAGVELASTDFPNKNLNIPGEVFFGYDATCADVIVAVAQASCTFAMINREDKLEFRWFSEADFTVPLDNQYSFPVIETEYGPINSLVLAREPQNDNVYIQNQESIEQNGLTELKFSDNPFLDIDRYNSRTAIWNRVNGFSYIPLTASTPGYFHLDCGDIINIQAEGGNYIELYVMNHTLEYSGGIKSIFSTPALSKNQINYSIASTVESRILKTELTVDKIQGEINSFIEETTTKIEEIDATKYSVALENTGTDLYMATDTVTLNVKLYANNEDVTDDQLDIQFQWYKNETAFKTGKSIVISPNDVDVYANFYCKVTIGDLIKNTQTVSITDNNDIASLGNSFLDTNTSLVQTLNDGIYFPNWSTNNVLITPAIINGVVNVDLSECEIEYKRIVNGEESALVTGESVNNGILTVNKNVLTKENPSLTYVCYVTYKNTEIKLYISFYLNAVAQDGNDGQDGSDGKNGTDGVSVVNIINYFALSSSDTQAPASGWITTKPDRSEGQWLWRKDVTKLSDGSEITTPAYVVTGDKGDTGPQGPQGKQGIQGPAGTDGKTTYFHIKYSSVANPTSSSQLTETPSEYIGTYVDFNINDSNDPSDYTWSRFKGIQGDKGDQGIPGTNGADGKTSYLHVKYSDNGTSFTANNGETPGKYMGTYVDFVQSDSTVFNDYTWVKIEGPQGVQGPKGADGIQYYTWLKYADSPTSGMSDSPDGKAYIGLAYNKTTATESSNYSDYTWSKIKGEKGDQGIQGPSGANGQTLYTWVKYATSASGANMSDDPSGKTYIGLAYNKTTATESTNASDYTWSLIKGDKGDTGAAGRGIKGTPVTTYQSGTTATTPPTGTWSSSIPTVAQGSYLWSKTVYTYTDNSTSTVYAVNRNPSDGKNGTNGTDGKDGKGIKSTATSYQASSSGTTVPTGTWTSAVPSTTAGQYLWTRTITTYTDNTTSTAYSVGRNGTNGADAAVMSATAPSDTSKLWYDTANNLLKYWNGETWEAVNDYAEDLNNMKQQITTEYNSAINQLKNSLTTLVEEISTTSSANSEAISNLSTQIAQNSSSITLATNSIQQITDKITGLTTKEEISQWARYQNGVLELGSSNSPFAVKLSQTELGFYQNGTRIAYLSNQQLNISQAVVLQRIDIGPFKIEYISSTGLVIG